MSVWSFHETTSQSDSCMSRGDVQMVFTRSLILSPVSTVGNLQPKVAEHAKSIKWDNANPLIITTGCNPSFTAGARQAAASHPGNSVIMLSGFAPPAHKEHNTPAADGKLVLSRTSQHERETSARTVEFIRNNTVGPVGGRLQTPVCSSPFPKQIYFDVHFNKHFTFIDFKREENRLWHSFKEVPEQGHHSAVYFNRHALSGR